MHIKDAVITRMSYLRRPAKRKLINWARRLEKRKGLEIGGPSSLFSLKGYFPVYLYAGAIDGVNFSTETLWEGSLQEGNNYRWHRKTGYQYIREATDLAGIADESYDVVLSCHSLEHVANPLKALYEWKRVLKPGGILVLVLPDKRYTFDVNRPYTTMAHLLDDYRNNTGENDTTHFEEIVRCFAPDKNPHLSSREELAARLKLNFTERSVHHHVFSQELVKELMQHLSFTTLYQQEAAPFHLITIAEKK
jgi:ubiquinone/menaquinone biosynthesis C-methylase UbiE